MAGRSCVLVLCVPSPLAPTPPLPPTPARTAGGKVDVGEAPEAALVRELQEELGIAVSPAALRPLTFASHAYETFHLLMPTYECSTWVGEPTGQEGQALAWVTAEELEGGGYAMPPADLPMLPPVLAAMHARRAAAAVAAAAGAPA